MSSLKNSVLNLKVNFIQIFGLFFKETELEEPKRRYQYGGTRFGNAGGNIGIQGKNSGNLDIGGSFSGRGVYNFLY